MTDRPDNLRGAALMALCALLFAAEALMIRLLLARGIPIEVQVLFRAAGQLLWVAPLLIASGLAVFSTRRPGLHLLRGLCSVTTWGLYYLSFAYLDLATATVLSFTNVMFTTLLAGPLLGERVDGARWAGTLAGFAGVAIMLRPGAEVSPTGVAVALAAALAWCGITLTSRLLTRTESTPTVLAWVGLVTTLAAAPFALSAWVPLGLTDLLLLIGFGLFAPGIIWLLTEALRAGEASAIAPFQYLRLLAIALAGWLLYGEVPDLFAILGAALILAGAVVITLAEAKRR
ncbi:MAG: DMT family transporter [Rhodovarius sp.]|nr:DMT family transporter [Rhodovarius sp.]MCX8134555.1 DMT family transporter [Roseococcus sp.]MDW8315723.1 DMT family transporter [Rhodovarius sp.]